MSNVSSTDNDCDDCDRSLRIAELIDSKREELARAESQDQGKPVSLARNMDIPRAAYNFRKFAHAWQVRSSSYNQNQRE